MKFSQCRKSKRKETDRIGIGVRGETSIHGQEGRRIAEDQTEVRARHIRRGEESGWKDAEI